MDEAAAEAAEKAAEKLLELLNVSRRISRAAELTKFFRESVYALVEAESETGSDEERAANISWASLAANIMFAQAFVHGEMDDRELLDRCEQILNSGHIAIDGASIGKHRDHAARAVADPYVMHDLCMIVSDPGMEMHLRECARFDLILARRYADEGQVVMIDDALGYGLPVKGR